jgi:hypothetical protein
MNTLPWTIAAAVVTLAAAPVIGTFDLAAYLRGGDNATISRLSQRVAWFFAPYQWAVCFLVGVLCGHLFTTRPCEPVVPRGVSVALCVVLPYLIALGSMLAGLRAPGGLPAAGSQSQIELAPVLVALTLGAFAGAYLLHQTGP